MKTNRPTETPISTGKLHRISQAAIDVCGTLSRISYPCINCNYKWNMNVMLRMQWVTALSLSINSKHRSAVIWRLHPYNISSCRKTTEMQALIYAEKWFKQLIMHIKHRLRLLQNVQTTRKNNNNSSSKRISVWTSLSFWQLRSSRHIGLRNVYRASAQHHAMQNADALYALAIPKTSVWVCPSVTPWHCIKTTQARITRSSPSGPWRTQVSGSVKLFQKFERGHLDRGR